MWHYPPARTTLGLSQLLQCVRVGNKPDLSISLIKRVGSIDCYHLSSWVSALALFLNELAQQDGNKSEVILPRYSCFEFSLAVQLAGLTPCYIDVTNDLQMDLNELENAISRRTLALMAINNVGIFSVMDRIKSLAADAGVCVIEDATYTLFGDCHGVKAGVVGDVAVLNFSEGKAVPIGGGAMLLNNVAYSAQFNRCKKAVDRLPETKPLKERFDGMVYFLGSTVPVYTLYKQLTRFFKRDLKEKLSMEKSRRNRDQILADLKGDDKRTRDSILSNQTAIGAIKQSLGSHYCENAAAQLELRSEIVRCYRKKLEHLDGVRLFEIKDDQYMNRYPLCCQRFNSESFEKWKWLGLSRLYGPESELNQPDANEKNSLDFFNHLITLPVYPGISGNHVNMICHAVAEISGTQSLIWSKE